MAQVDCLVQILAEKNVDLGMQISKSDLDLFQNTVTYFLEQTLICLEYNRSVDAHYDKISLQTLSPLRTNFLFIDNSTFRAERFHPIVRNVVLPNCTNALKVALFLQNSDATSISKMITKQILRYKIEINVPCEVYFIEGPEISINTDTQFELPEKYILYIFREEDTLVVHKNRTLTLKRTKRGWFRYSTNNDRLRFQTLTAHLSLGVFHPEHHRFLFSKECYPVKTFSEEQKQFAKRIFELESLFVAKRK